MVRVRGQVSCLFESINELPMWLVNYNLSWNNLFNYFFFFWHVQSCVLKMVSNWESCKAGEMKGRGKGVVRKCHVPVHL